MRGFSCRCGQRGGSLREETQSCRLGRRASAPHTPNPVTPRDTGETLGVLVGFSVKLSLRGQGLSKRGGSGTQKSSPRDAPFSDYGDPSHRARPAAAHSQLTDSCKPLSSCSQRSGPRAVSRPCPHTCTCRSAGLLREGCSQTPGTAPEPIWLEVGVMAGEPGRMEVLANPSPSQAWGQASPGSGRGRTGSGRPSHPGEPVPAICTSQRVVGSPVLAGGFFTTEPSATCLRATHLDSSIPPPQSPPPPDDVNFRPEI